MSLDCFSKPVVLHFERRWPCSCQYFTIVFGIPVSIPSLCHLLPFYLSYVTVPRPGLLVEILP